MLPDVALLEIFDCYVNLFQEEETGYRFQVQAWHTLVHVCRKWRIIVFESPRRLDLQLYCTEEIPVKETLAVWPPLPIVIRQDVHPTKQIDNIIVALEHNDRVCQIDLMDVTNSQLDEVLAAMRQPFPALTYLAIGRWNDELEGETPPVISESFLRGSAPRLQDLVLYLVPFPGLPKLLLSATHLVRLDFSKIPHSGYISPEAIVACLSTLTRLEKLWLRFESPRSRPDRQRRRPHPPTRSALSALTSFIFFGVSEYLEDFVARIDAPRLDNLHIMLFHQLIFDTPQLVQFIARTPNIQPPVEPCVVFTKLYVEITSSRTFPKTFVLGTRCRQSDWQLSSLAQVCRSSLPDTFIPKVERLYISQNDYDRPHWQDDIEVSQWLEVLNPFTPLKDLHLSREFVPRIAPVFQELAVGNVTEVLPALQSLFLEDLDPSGPVREAIEKFVAARQLADHPIVVLGPDGKQLIGGQ